MLNVIIHVQCFYQQFDILISYIKLMELHDTNCNITSQRINCYGSNYASKRCDFC